MLPASGKIGIRSLRSKRGTIFSAYFKYIFNEKTRYYYIKDLFEKNIALENLAKIVDADNQKLYNKLIKDYSKAVHHLESRWNKISRKYDWEGENWWLGFEARKTITNQ